MLLQVNTRSKVDTIQVVSSALCLSWSVRDFVPFDPLPVVTLGQFGCKRLFNIELDIILLRC